MVFSVNFSVLNFRLDHNSMPDMVCNLRAPKRLRQLSSIVYRSEIKWKQHSWNHSEMFWKISGLFRAHWCIYSYVKKYANAKIISAHFSHNQRSECNDTEGDAITLPTV